MDIAKGRQSLFLDITGHGRHKEYLKLYLFKKPKTFLDKKHNEETLRQAKELCANRQLEIQGESHGIKYIAPSKNSFGTMFQSYVDEYPNKDINKFKATLYHYKQFNQDKPVLMNQMFVDRLKKYLKSDAKLTGETPLVYLKIIKRICKLAFKERIIKANPDEFNWKMKIDRHAMRKEVLDAEEINKLAKAPCGNETVKRLFFFCCNTGLRFGDASGLTWNDIKGMRIKIEQGKTGRFILQDLNETAKRMVGEPGKDDEPVFDLKGIDGINGVIETWYKKAKLDKHITTHCARHTFCTNLMRNKTPAKTIISLMGWDEVSGMKQLMRYAHLVDETLKEAVDSLPEIEY